jgi:hypothetical protein
MLGFDVDGRATVLDTSANVLRHEVVVGVRMAVTYRVVAVEGGSVLHHEMTTHLPGGLLGRPLSFFLRRRLKKMQHALIEGLGVVTHASVAPAPFDEVPESISR